MIRFVLLKYFWLTFSLNPYLNPFFDSELSDLLELNALESVHIAINKLPLDLMFLIFNVIS
mgnify:CR=1 FL=1